MGYFEQSRPGGWIADRTTSCLGVTSYRRRGTGATGCYRSHAKQAAAKFAAVKMPRPKNLETVYARDNLDDRREIYRLLGFPGFTDHMRLDFVAWCCRLSNSKAVQSRPQQKNKYTPVEACDDILALVVQFGMNLDKALAELSKRVRRL